jgi:prephenate dehydrogenase
MGVGAQVRTMTPEAHDAAFAAVSHLPHLLAFAAFLSVAHQPDGELFLDLAGPGFRDFTRIAASDAKVWRDILLANRTQVLMQSEQFKTTLFQFEAAMREGKADVIETLIKEAARGRARWQSNGPRNGS